MYTKQRPVLTARASKALYQLAYVCSGTAFGLAALCVEEQRRRIQIVQRIADNAKLLRQHPRYRHQAALAVEADDEGWAGNTGDGPLSGRRQRWREAEMEGRYAHQNGALKSAVLPSVIEHGYEELVGTPRVRRDPRAHVQYKSGTSRHARSTTEYRPFFICTHPRNESEQQVSTSSKSANAVSARSSVAQHGEDDALSRWAIKRADNGWSFSSKRSDELPVDSVASALGIDNSNEVFTTRPAWQKDSDTESALHALSGSENSSCPSANNISHDVSLFLQESRRARQAEVNTDRHLQIANQLLKLALANGRLEDIRALCSWKLNNNAFTVADASIVCQSCNDLAGRAVIDNSQLADFYTEVLRPNTLHQTKAMASPEYIIGVFAELLNSNLRQEAINSGNELVKSLFSRMSEDVIAQALDDKCKDLLADSQIGQAASLFLAIAGMCTHKLLFTPVADHILDTVPAQSDLRYCTVLLRWKKKHAHDEAMQRQLNVFIKACRERQAYAIVTDLLFRKSGLGLSTKALLNATSAESKATIAVACGSVPSFSRYFDTFYRELPKEQRIFVNKSSADRSIIATWNSTRNLDEVETRHKEALGCLETNVDSKAIRKLNEAVLDIYIRANKVQSALAMIARLHRDKPDARVMCLGALAFAKQQNWDSFSSIMEMLRDMEPVQRDDEAKRLLDRIVQAYSAHHNANATWVFATCTIDHFRLSASDRTMQRVLKTFVADKQLHLIQEWAQFLDARGQKLQLNSKSVSTLLRLFYLDRRPSHILMMWLCRKLLYHAPDLASTHMIQLVKQAIGYDLRNYFGPSARSQRSHALQRLTRFEKHSNHIPSHGFSVGDQLYFPDADMDFTKLPELDPTTEITDQGRGKILMADSPQEFANKIGHENFLPALDLFERIEPPQLDYAIDGHGRSEVQGDMMVPFSLGEYGEVLRLYDESRDAIGVPSSPIALQIAIEASLRLHRGDESDAKAIMAKAQEAGMNVGCAMGPLLINQMQRMHSITNIEATRYQQAVTDYYRETYEEGWPIRHHVATTAANVLTAKGHPAHGIQILSMMNHSEWAKAQPLDLVAMVVFLKSYVALQSASGIQWVIGTVVDQDMRITKGFLHQLRQAAKMDWQQRLGDQAGQSFARLLDSLTHIVQDRLTLQMQENKKFGKELIKTLVQIGQRGRSTVEDQSVANKELEDGTVFMKPFQFGPDVVYPTDHAHEVRRKIQEEGNRGLVLRHLTTSARYEQYLARRRKREPELSIEDQSKGQDALADLEELQRRNPKLSDGEYSSNGDDSENLERRFSNGDALVNIDDALDDPGSRFHRRHG